MSKCLECGYYDKEKHYCPFYCQLIRETLNEAISFELEKIKAEIEEHNRNYISDDNAGLERAIYDFIEPHIAELKGE